MPGGTNMPSPTSYTEATPLADRQLCMGIHRRRLAGPFSVEVDDFCVVCSKTELL